MCVSFGLTAFGNIDTARDNFFCEIFQCEKEVHFQQHLHMLHCNVDCTGVRGKGGIEEGRVRRGERCGWEEGKKVRSGKL